MGRVDFIPAALHDEDVVGQDPPGLGGVVTPATDVGLWARSMARKIVEARHPLEVVVTGTS